MAKASAPIPRPRVLKTKWFAKEARKEGIADTELCKKARGVARGVGEDLGGGLWKLRVGVGRGIARAIILTKSDDFWVFQALYAKDVSSNLSTAGKKALRDVADDYAAILNALSVAELLQNKGWEEICNDD